MNKQTFIEKLQQLRTLADECLIELSSRDGSKQFKKSVKKINPEIIPKQITASKNKIDFSIPIRPFVKQHSKGMSGPKKFTLILAHMVKGDLKKSANLNDIKKQWNKMTAKSLLGMKFNLFYPSQAKNNDWVESPQKGIYNLRPSWTNILK